MSGTKTEPKRRQTFNCKGKLIETIIFRKIKKRVILFEEFKIVLRKLKII